MFHQGYWYLDYNGNGVWDGVATRQELRLRLGRRGAGGGELVRRVAIPVRRVRALANEGRPREVENRRPSPL